MTTHGREVASPLRGRLHDGDSEPPSSGPAFALPLFAPSVSLGDEGPSVWGEGDALTYALSASGLGHWRLSLDTGRIWVSEGCLASLGLDADDELESIAELLTYVHVDDRAAWTRAFDRAVRETGEFAAEHRVVTRSGEQRWFMVRGRVCRCSGGHAAMAGIIIDVSAQKAAEAERERLIAELAHERARLRALIDHMPVAIVMSEVSTGSIVLTNPTAEAVFALSPLAKPMPARELFARLPARYPDGRPVEPDDRPIARAERGEHLDSADYRFVRGDGLESWVRLSSAPIRDEGGAITGGVVLAVNVDREKAAEEALRASERRHRQLFESTAIGIIRADIDGRITSANDTFLRMLGYGREDLAAGRLNWREMTPPEHVDGNVQRTEELLTTGRLRLSEKAYQHRDGTSIPVMISGTMLEGSQTELVTFLLDISDRKRVEAERESLLRSLARSREFERQLIGIVSHDLRNPLNTILLGAEMLVDSPGLGDRPQQNARRIRAAAQRATRMIHDLLDFTKARLGAGISIDRRNVDLASIFPPLVDEIRASHPDRTIAFGVHRDCSGYFDADRLLQVLTNLVENALKYSPPRSPVTVTLRGEATDVVLAVQNYGPPIAEDLLGRIFEPLQRGDGGFDPAGRSVGLGLYIVKSLVDAHEGTVEVRSSESDGTQFRVRLPRSTGGRAA